MKLEEIMNKNLEIIDPEATVYDAIERLVDKRIRSLVIAPEKGKNDYGVITVRDIVFKVFHKGLDIQKTKIKEIASQPLICIHKDTHIKEIIDLMASSNIARVFVCENNKVVGVVSLLDILKAFLIQKVKGEKVV